MRARTDRCGAPRASDQAPSDSDESMDPCPQKPDRILTRHSCHREQVHGEHTKAVHSGGRWASGRSVLSLRNRLGWTVRSRRRCNQRKESPRVGTRPAVDDRAWRSGVERGAAANPLGNDGDSAPRVVDALRQLGRHRAPGDRAAGSHLGAGGAVREWTRSSRCRAGVPAPGDPVPIGRALSLIRARARRHQRSDRHRTLRPRRAAGGADGTLGIAGAPRCDRAPRGT